MHDSNTDLELDDAMAEALLQQVQYNIPADGCAQAIICIVRDRGAAKKPSWASSSLRRIAEIATAAAELYENPDYVTATVLRIQKVDAETAARRAAQ